jgi:putative FmdB family regulatory protein
MPTYDYRCNACEHIFEEVHMMDDDLVPTKKPCPECGKKEVTKSWAGVTPGIGCDMTLTPDKATGGDWSEMMGRIKKGMPKRYHTGIDKSTNMNGKRWKG